MSLTKRFNIKARAEINTGFGANTSDYGGRFLNKDGNANIEKTGLGFFEKISWFHTMLTLPSWEFFGIIFVFFIAINLFFACIYFLIGMDQLGGIISNTHARDFLEAFFFSCQTFTTVGYGRINPVGIITSSVAAFESLLGLLNFALATGLLYGRFARPKAYLKFSENALVAPYKTITALMLRVAPFKNATLVEAEAKVTLGLIMEEDGRKVNRFFQLPLEFSSVNALTLSWTIVHPINQESPLYGFTKEDYQSLQGEIIIYVKAFDDMFSNTVVRRTSYLFSEIVYGAKFQPMFTPSPQSRKTVLQFEKLNSFVPAQLPGPSQKEKAT